MIMKSHFGITIREHASPGTRKRKRCKSMHASNARGLAITIRVHVSMQSRFGITIRVSLVSVPVLTARASACEGSSTSIRRGMFGNRAARVASRVGKNLTCKYPDNLHCTHEHCIHVDCIHDDGQAILRMHALHSIDEYGQADLGIMTVRS